MVRAPRRPGHYSCLLAIAAALALSSCGTGPRRRGERSTVQLARLGGRALVGAEYERADRAGSDTERLLLREEVGVKADGVVYDERFLRFALGAAIATTQADDLDRAGGFDSTTFPLYDAQLRFLERHAYPVTLFASRDESREIVQSRDRSPLISSRRQTVGMRVGLRFDPLDCSVGLRRTDLETSGVGESRSESHDMLEAELRHEPDARLRTEGRFKLEQVREMPVDQDYESLTLQLVNTLETGSLDGRPQRTFRTSFDAWDRSGTSDASSERFAEAVTWLLDKNLESLTQFDFERYGDEATTDRRAISETLVHRLYQSLTTTVGGRYSRDEAPDARVDQRGGSAGVSYTKSLPIGRLTLGYHYDIDRQADEGRTAIRQVVGETVTLLTGRLTVLRHADIDRSSVVVTDAPRGTVYTLGLDYRLVRRGRRFELLRSVDGRIPDASLVLVDYTYRAPSDLTFDTTDRSADATLQITEFLQIYGSRGKTQQDAVRGVDLGQLENTQTTRLGAHVRAFGFRALGEHEEHESSFSPHRQRRAEIGYTRHLSDSTLIGLSASLLRVSFEQGEDLDVRSVQGRVQTRGGRNLTLSCEPAYRDERGRGADTGTFSLRVNARYVYGELRFDFSIDHRARRLTGRDEADTFATFSVERRW